MNFLLIFGVVFLIINYIVEWVEARKYPPLVERDVEVQWLFPKMCIDVDPDADMVGYSVRKDAGTIPGVLLGIVSPYTLSDSDRKDKHEFKDVNVSVCGSGNFTARMCHNNTTHTVATHSMHVRLQYAHVCIHQHLTCCAQDKEELLILVNLPTMGSVTLRRVAVLKVTI